MNSINEILIFVGSLFVGILLSLEVGRRLGVRRRSKHPHSSDTGLGAVVGSMFALLGLLIAFTFSGAAARLDTRRQLIVEEANAIGTAYLRLDLLPGAARDKLRGSFRTYVDARLEIYRHLPDLEASRAALARSLMLQGEIWTDAVAACRESGAPQASLLLLPALNEMIDLTTSRTFVQHVHQPTIIFGILAVLALSCALLAGYDMADGEERSWIHMICFAGILAATLYVILDLEHPRVGVIRVDPADKILEDVRDSMK